MKRDFPTLNEMLFFNISVIGDNEEVTLAQLHLHRRRLAKSHSRVNYHKRFLPSPYRVVLYQIQPEYKRKFYEDARTMKLASLPVSHMTKGGWHTLDVTAVIRELLINAQGPIELLFGVQFEAPKRSDKSHSPIVPIKHFLKNPNFHNSENPHKASSYLVIYSEADPFFEEFEEDTILSTSNTVPTPTTEEYLKERHLKHKILKGNNEDYNSNRFNGGKMPDKNGKDKALWKYRKMENEVLKSKKNDVIRHKGKHKGNEIKRSKADELALKEKTKLKSLPFLHANEVEEIRQTSRRLTRSSMIHRNPTKNMASDLVSLSKVSLNYFQLFIGF